MAEQIIQKEDPIANKEVEFNETVQQDEDTNRNKEGIPMTGKSMISNIRR